MSLVYVAAAFVVVYFWLQLFPDSDRVTPQQQAIRASLTAVVVFPAAASTSGVITPEYTPVFFGVPPEAATQYYPTADYSTRVPVTAAPTITPTPTVTPTPTLHPETATYEAWLLLPTFTPQPSPTLTATPGYTWINGCCLARWTGDGWDIVLTPGGG